ncbi:MAG: DUF1573 domain-containing protein [Planctomycetes bacterium]|nr:DUF1573 domain-containing protein [Planctomycetota bacterium]
MSFRRLTTLSGLAVSCLIAAPLMARQAQQAPAQQPPAQLPSGDRLPPRPGQLSPAPATPVGPCGRFTPDEKSFNFGKILSSNSVEHVFKFKNTGDANLVITSASGSCHCTVPQLAKMEYAPGEVGEIKVIFDPKGKAAGPVQQRVTVVSNDPTSPTSSLMIEADVQPIVMVEPKLVAFNQLAKGESRKVDMSVTGRMDGFAITDIRFDGEGEKIKTEIGKPEQVEINGEKMFKIPVKVIYPPASRIERFNRFMYITTNDTREKEVKIPVLGEVQGDIEAKPQRITMGLVARGAEFSNTATIGSRSGKPFRILGIKQIATQQDRKDPQLKFEFKPITRDGKPAAGSQSDYYNVAVSGVAPNDTFRGVIDFDVQTDVAGEENVRVGVYLVVR